MSAAATAGRLPPPAARRVLESLLDRNLLEQRCRDHYRMHDLVRLYADKMRRAVGGGAPEWTIPVTRLPAERALPRL